MHRQRDWRALGGDYRELEPAGKLLLIDSFLAPAVATPLAEALRGGLDWAQRPIMMFGREVLQPRLTAFHGDPNVAYTYSGKTMKAVPWTEDLAALRDHISEFSGQAFNSVLCNFYRDGQDSMGWHADNEPELGLNPLIASLSFGARRRFQLKSRLGSQRLELELGHGSLLLMGGDCQHHWLHQLPKTRRPLAWRLNLTFRTVVPHRPDRRPR